MSRKSTENNPDCFIVHTKHKTFACWQNHLNLIVPGVINTAEYIDCRGHQRRTWLLVFVTVKALQQAAGLLVDSLCPPTFLCLVLQSFNLCINPLWLHSPESYCITSGSPLLLLPLDSCSIWMVTVSYIIWSPCLFYTDSRGCCSASWLPKLQRRHHSSTSNQQCSNFTSKE